MHFQNLAEIEILSHEAKGIVNVLIDGLNNDVCPTMTEDASVVLGIIRNKIEQIEKIIEEEYANRRQQMKAIMKQDRQRILGEDYDEDEDDDDEDDEDDNVVVESNGITVTHKEDHEDGSATFEFHMSDEMLHKLFEIFTVSGIVNGIKYEKKNIDSFIAEQKVIDAAKNFEAKMREWEEEEDCDYEPECRKVREALSAAIKEL